MAADDRVTIADAAGNRRDVRLDDYIDAGAIEHAERAANAWIKALRHASVEEAPLRDRLTYRGDSLWWFVELFLHKERVIVSAYRAIAALESIVARERPAAILPGDSPLLRVLVPQVAQRYELGVTTERRARRPSYEDGERPARRPSHEDGERRAGRPSHEDGERPAGRPSYEDGERWAGRPSHEDGERPAGRPSHEDGERWAGRPSHEDGERPAERPSHEDEKREWPLSGSRLRTLARGWFHTASAMADRVRPGAGRAGVAGPVEVAAFVHSAFWRQDRGEEGYVGPVLRALEARLPPASLVLVGLGPRTNFRVRGWRHRLAEFNDPHARDLPLIPVEALAAWPAIRPSLSVWRERHRILGALVSSPDLRRAAVIDGYDLWPILREQLLGITHLQLPWSARAMDETGAALDALKPRIVVTYAEAGGWGRALTLEARRRGIPVAGLQHGFIYRHWLNYLHEPDEMAMSARHPEDRGFPRPDLTLLYDGFAERHLIEAGCFPPSSLAVTGSTRLEAFVEAGRRLTSDERERIRASAGATPGRKLVVLATKFTQVGPWFAPLVEAIAGMTDAHLAVKCHPAEAPAPYERVAGSTPNVRVLSSGADLAALVACADLLVTVNSTAAVEAMALDVPGLVLALPNNLSPFVEAGVLAGVERCAEIGPAIRGLLYDQEKRQQLSSRRRAFVSRYGIVSEGGAADRAADAILALGGRRPQS